MLSPANTLAAIVTICSKQRKTTTRILTFLVVLHASAEAATKKTLLQSSKEVAPEAMTSQRECATSERVHKEKVQIFQVRISG